MSGPYSRVYWSIRSDERFAGVYTDDAALAAWLRLLILADGVYPAPADIPAWLKPETLALLADRGLIEVVDSFHYCVHGLAAERERRSQRGKAGAEAMWQRRNANAYADAERTHMQTQSERNATERTDALLAEPSRAETSQAEQGAANASDDPYAVYASLFGRPSKTVTEWIDRLTAIHGGTETGNAIAQAVKDGIDRGRVMGVAESYLSERKRRQLRAVKPKKADPFYEEYRASIEAKYGDATA